MGKFECGKEVGVPAKSMTEGCCTSKGQEVTRADVSALWLDVEKFTPQKIEGQTFTDWASMVTYLKNNLPAVVLKKTILGIAPKEWESLAPRQISGTATYEQRIKPGKLPQDEVRAFTICARSTKQENPCREYVCTNIPNFWKKHVKPAQAWKP